MPLTLQNKSKLESACRRSWMYRGTTYRFTDFTEAGDSIIISTDIKALKISADAVGDFLKECLPAADPLPAKKNGHDLSLPGVETGIFQEITTGLMTSFREIQGSKDPHFLKEATARAKAKIDISKAITNVAKTVIAGKKAMTEK